MTIDAKVVEFSVGSRAIIDRRGDVTLISGTQAMTLRKREVEKFIGAYSMERVGHTNGGGKT